MLNKNSKLKAFIRENLNPKTFVSTLKLQVVHNQVLLMVNNFAKNISHLKTDVTDVSIPIENNKLVNNLKTISSL